MSLHLLKLCVGAESISDLEDWIAERQAQRRARGEPAEQLHTTRMVPKKIEEILDGGSLYWVIKGSVTCRQRILEITTIGEGKASRCEIKLDSQVIRTAPLARRPFQGWRYFEKDVPPDLSVAEPTDLPPDLARELRELGAW